LLLEWERKRSAQLGVKDEEALLVSEGRALPGSAELESQVAAAVESLGGIFATAISALPSAPWGKFRIRIFSSCHRCGPKAVRLQRGVMIFFLALMLALNGFVIFQAGVDGRC